MTWLVGTITMCFLRAEWQKNYSHTHRRNTSGVCEKLLSVEGQVITP